VLRTELEDILDKVAQRQFEPIMPDGFRFPTSEWNKHQFFLATKPGLYDLLAYAYVNQAHRVNQIWDWRRGIANTENIGASVDDDLDEVEEAATHAIAALDKIIAESQP